MTDKEIIIDGVDVSGCKKLHWDIAPFLKKEERPFNQHEWKCGGGFAQTYCHNDKNCLYKRLKRKEQECEELKEKLRKLELENTTLQNRNQQLDGSMTECDRYRKALEEIEKKCKKLSTEWEAYQDETCIFNCKTRKTNRAKLADKILNIIDKAKGEENE